MVRSTDRPAMTIAVDLGRKATKQTNKYITTIFSTMNKLSCRLIPNMYKDNKISAVSAKIFLS